MSRIEVDRGGHRIVIEHSGELAPMMDAALSLWEKTKSDKPPAGFATQEERKQQR